ncbi:MULTISPECIES: GNAT family protein [Clostridium]|uniref:GNAT family N-acetyltransferase n=1 Tax=Clostridium senegalense TaxID=1465809 RepID=A0A6M0H7B0_9CLOT|nr:MULTISPECIES: GNAT family protein [Clostridium]NEU06575.1 GNAT family N-acetyltransferase [Clostridium senegalense]
MKNNDLELRQEVFKSDAIKILQWMEDEEITRYLNESPNVCSSIRNTLNSINLPVLTHLFNQNGSFYMITKKDESIGFLKLIPKGKAVEIVIVIGDKEKWGMGLGSNAIFQGLKEAFFYWRVDEVIAKINFENERSKRVFKKVGFDVDRELKKEIQYNMTMNKFLKIAA